MRYNAAMKNGFEISNRGGQPPKQPVIPGFKYEQAIDWATKGIPPEVQQASGERTLPRAKAKQWDFETVMRRARDLRGNATPVHEGDME